MRRGIYTITAPSGNCYVGSSVDVPRRFAQHRSALRRGTHENTSLLAAYAKYGDRLVFKQIVSVPDAADLLRVEQMAIDALRPAYNATRNAALPFHDPAVRLRATESARMSRHHAEARRNNQRKAAAAISRPVVRLTDSRLFPSGYAAAAEHGAHTPDNIFTAIRKGWKFAGHYWCYADKPIDIETVHAAARRHEIIRKVRATRGMIATAARPVTRLTDGAHFPSIADAARAEGCNKSAIDRALRCGTRSCGSHWCYVDGSE